MVGRRFNAGADSIWERVATRRTDRCSSLQAINGLPTIRRSLRDRNTAPNLSTWLVGLSGCWHCAALGRRADVVVDFSLVSRIVIPRRTQVCHGQFRVVFQNARVGESKLLPLDQTRDGMARIADA